MHSLELFDYIWIKHLCLDTIWAIVVNVWPTSKPICRLSSSNKHAKILEFPPWLARGRHPLFGHLQSVSWPIPRLDRSLTKVRGFLHVTRDHSWVWTVEELATCPPSKFMDTKCGNSKVGPLALPILQNKHLCWCGMRHLHNPQRRGRLSKLNLWKHLALMSGWYQLQLTPSRILLYG